MSAEIVDDLRDLIRIPTVNPPGENYEEFVERFGGMPGVLGYETEVFRVPKDRLAELVPHAEGASAPEPRRPPGRPFIRAETASSTGLYPFGYR